MLSVVIPAYNEEASIPYAIQKIGEVLQSANIPYELIFVDDGSTDGSWREVLSAREQDPTIRGIRFSRNFGKEAAIFSGLSVTNGDCCAVMDCDLQHPPEKLPEMYALWQQGWEVVNGVKKDRGRESGFHRFAANSFYKIMGKTLRIDISHSSDFKLMDRKVVDALLALSERKTFFRALTAWAGFRTVELEFSVAERMTGNTHWSTISLFRYAISNIASYSSAPMQIVTIFGVLTLLLSMILGVQTFVNWASGSAADGFTTVIILILLIGSVLMISLGIIGYYIAQIFYEIKARPRYIIAEICGQERSSV